MPLRTVSKYLGTSECLSSLLGNCVCVSFETVNIYRVGGVKQPLADTVSKLNYYLVKSGITLNFWGLCDAKKCG